MWLPPPPSGPHPILAAVCTSTNISRNASDSQLLVLSRTVDKSLDQRFQDFFISYRQWFLSTLENKTNVLWSNLKTDKREDIRPKNLDNTWQIMFNPFAESDFWPLASDHAILQQRGDYSKPFLTSGQARPDREIWRQWQWYIGCHPATE